MADKTKEIAVVLLNLGGPDSLKAVRPFLINLFSDRDIIRLGPSFMQKPLAFLISRLRSKKTEELYSMIGCKSPILDITTAQAEALEKALNQNTEHRTQSTDNPPLPPFSKGGMGGIVFKVYVGMRYWHPFICDTVKRVIDDGVKHVIILSLYPHYSKATTGSAIAEFKKAIERFRTLPAGRPVPDVIQYIDHWYDFQPYIDCLAKNMTDEIADFKREDFDILYSAHSLPEGFIKQGDPYLEHIKSTIKAVNASIVGRSLASGPGLDSSWRGGRSNGPRAKLTGQSSIIKWHLSFQSRSGPVKWLSPSTDETIIKLAKQGVKNLLVVPISFVSDHIETLYEIDILYRDIALKNGINLKRCRSLNVSDGFISALKELVLKNAD